MPLATGIVMVSSWSERAVDEKSAASAAASASARISRMRGEWASRIRRWTWKGDPPT